jgi:Ca-activated chloride channel family protein
VTGYIHRDKEQDAYFTVSLAAPELPASATMAKDVTLVIDRSGSMMGELIRQARAACIDIVKRLRSDDRLNILLFDHQVEKLFEQPKPVTEAIRRQAIEYLEMMDEGGATDLALALEQAMGAQASGGNRPRVVMFFTDGRSAVQTVLDAAQADKRDVRVFTVGFGPEVNRPLLFRLAARKRGRFTYISSASNIEREVSVLYRQIDAPVLVDVSLETEGGAISRVYPPTIPDLFVDDELRISGRLRAAGPVTFTLKGKQGGRAFARTIKLEGTAEIKRPWVARQWAGARVEDLLDEMALTGKRAEFENEVLDLALAYNFTTPYTAFLAIPESEVDWMSAHQLAGARAYKAEILRRKSDAAHVAGGSGGSSRWSAEEAGGGSAPRLAEQQRSFSRRENSPSPMSQSAPASDAESGSPAPPPEPHAKKMAMNDEESENPLDSKEGPIKAATLGSRREPGGCASCALGGETSSLAGLALAAVALAIATRRRRR